MQEGVEPGQSVLSEHGEVVGGVMLADCMGVGEGVLAADGVSAR